MADFSSNRRDLTLVISAVSAIFVGLVGTNVLDIEHSSRPMGWADHAAIVLWLPALLLLGVCAYKAPNPEPWQRRGAWGATAIAGTVTAAVLLFTGFNFTRDTDHVRVLLTPDASARVRSLCGLGIDHGVDHNDFYGTIRTETLQLAFVTVDVTGKSQTSCSVDVPRGEVREIREHPPRRR